LILSKKNSDTLINNSYKTTWESKWWK